MNCPHCSLAVDPADAHCKYCGAALHANPADLSPELNRLIEDKARAVVARERDLATRQDVYDLVTQAAAENKAKIAAATSRLAIVRAEPRRVWRLTIGTAIFALVIAMGLGLPSAWVFEGVTEKPVGGSVLCPFVCPTCRGPGRVFSWTTREGVNQQGEHSVAICNTPGLDLNHLDPALVKVGSPGAELSWWMRMPLFATILTLLGLAGFPFLFAKMAAKSFDREAKELEERIRNLTLTAAGAAPPYRSVQ